MVTKKKTPHYRVDATPEKAGSVELEPAVSFVVDSFEKWSDHWGGKFSEFEKYYDRWYGVAPKRDEEWQSKFHKRLTWQAEKALVARLHGALFPTSAPIDTEETEITDQMQALLAKSIVGHWFKIGEFTKEFLSSMRSGGIYGTGLLEDDWYVRKENVFEKKTTMMPDFRAMVDDRGQAVLDDLGRVRSEKIGERPMVKEESKVKVVEDRYRVRKANIFSWRFHPSKLTDDDDYPAIKQEFITYDSLLERQDELEKYGIEGFENLEAIKEDKFKIKDEDSRRFQKEGEFIDDKDPRLELLTYWGFYKEKEGDQGFNKKSGKRRTVFIMVINRKYRITLKDNPFWHKKPPVFHIVWTEDEKPSYYGIGLAQIGADAEDRANKVVNVRTDIRAKNLRGGGWYNALDKKIKKTELQMNVPGLYRGCSDINTAAKPDIPVPADPSDYKEEETAVNDHREITGATTSLLPTADNKEQHKTLGGLEILVGQGLQRLKPDLQMMEMMGIRRAANRAFLLTRQFMSESETIELLAPDDQLRQMGVKKIYELSPREILGDVHFVCTGLSESLDKQNNVQKLLQFSEVMGKIPQATAIVKWTEIAKQLAILSGLENPDKYIEMVPQPPPPQPQMPGAPMPGAPGMPGMPPGMPMPPMPPQMPQGGPGQIPMPQDLQVPPGQMAPPQGLPPALLLAIAQKMGASPNNLGVPPGMAMHH